MDSDRLRKQLDFIYEVDKVKHIVRKSKVFDGSKYENDAEHSWTVCLMACLLREYANFEVDIARVLLMLLIHDIVEVDAGDTFLYAEDRDSAPDREAAAARRIFGLLPDDQAGPFLAAWEEFEARETNEAKFASVFDRMEPVLQNYKTEGSTWKKHGITRRMVLEKNRHIENGSAELWRFFQALLEECVEKGYLEDS
ncbi:MAG: HD domain-containing protein [Spirochaetes bacterium]|nr:HD domain-containing protein [Spirochaetota bacterium]MBU1080827.1 HD domain-containing protein [Spirochaetota bacterium]